MLIKNSLFDGFDNGLLNLSLDKEFEALLTDNIQASIEKILQSNFGKIRLKITANKLIEKTLAQKQTQAKNKKNLALQKNFLADIGLQKLQQVFNAKVDIESIKAIKESKNV